MSEVADKPVIFLAFANDRDDTVGYLRNLPDEARQLRDVLRPAKQSGLCEVVVRQNSTAGDIFKVFQDQEYRNRIAVFHYGGHANGYQLLLESAAGQAAAADAGGLAAFLAQQQGLQLIFLNGCSTEQQTQGLLDANISAVISTSRSIEDQVATDFSCQFYQGLAGGANIRRAYNEAQAAVQTAKGSNTRALYFGDKDDSQSRLEADSWPWNLHVRKGSESADQWNLREAVIRQAAKVFLVPHRRNPYFQGRDEELDQLHRTLSDNNRAALGQAISGLGGIGKTQTALAYAYRYRDEYHAVFWVQAETTEQLINGFVEIADKLRLPHNRADAEEAVQATKDWLESHEDWLLVLDNADEPELVEPFLPTDVKGKGHVLLTSRARVFDMLGIAPLKLDVLPIHEAVTLLFERTMRDRGHVAEMQSATELAELVGCLPLALEQAGAYMLAFEVSFARYLELYRKQPLTMLEKRGPVTGKYPMSVATTWAVNYQELANAQRDVLCVSAYLAPERIPLELFAEGRSELGDAIGEALADADLVSELLGPLHRVSLIGLDSVDESYSVHRLVQEVTKDALDAEFSRMWSERAVRAIYETFPDVELASWPLCERLVPHALLASRMIAEHDLASSQAARMLNQTAMYLKERGQYSVALPLFKQALEIRRKVLGEEHSDFATSLWWIAVLEQRKGNYDEAQRLYRQVVEIYTTALGPDHPNTKTARDNYERFLRERSDDD